MHLETFLPHYDIAEHYSRVISADIRTVYACVRNFQFVNTTLTNLLFSLRGLSPNKVSLQSVMDSGFILLAEEQDREFVFGLAGKFWIPSGCLQKLSPKEFMDFQTAGFAKAVWNFSFEKVSEYETRVTTETRVLCLDEKSRLRFNMYWFFVGPFSGIIRKEILRSIDRAVTTVQ